MKMLASIKSVNEAQTVLAAGVEMIDIKQPEHGALGALSVPEIMKILEHVAGRAYTSATIGDLPMQPSLLCERVNAVAATGVDIVKVGIFGRSYHIECIEALAPLTRSGIRLVAVLFADQNPNFQLVSHLANAGFYGVMLDTAQKDGYSLLDHMSQEKIAEFVLISRQQHLFCGLAGALKLNDIQPLEKVSPDFIGFRSALVKNGGRTGSIDENALLTVRKLLLHSNNFSGIVPQSDSSEWLHCNQIAE